MPTHIRLTAPLPPPPPPPPPPVVLVRYVRADGKIHTVNLQNANLADGRTHSIILRLGGLHRDNMHMELYVNCRLADSSQGLPPLVPLPREAEMVEIRHGQKAYARLQVRLREFGNYISCEENLFFIIIIIIIISSVRFHKERTSALKVPTQRVTLKLHVHTHTESDLLKQWC